MKSFEKFKQMINTCNENWHEARKLFDGPFASAIASTGTYGVYLLNLKDDYTKGKIAPEEVCKQLKKIGQDVNGVISLALMNETWVIAQEETGPTFDGFMELVSEEIKSLGDMAPQIYVKKAGGPKF